jgi:nucleoside 2-deoxyribosyltransferase
MKIYFSGSIRGAPGDRELYRLLIRHLSTHGRVLTENSFNLKTDDEYTADESQIWERDMNWIREADILIAEVTAPSHGVGYEIAFARGLGKSVLCLYRPEEGRKPSAMLLGDPMIEKREYADTYDACDKIDEWITELNAKRED